MGRYKSPIFVRVDTAGLEDVIRRLASLDKKAARKALRAGINEVTKLVLKEAKALVPRRTGQLRRSLGRKVKTYKGGGLVYGVVKPRAGVKVKGVWTPKFRKQFPGTGKFDKATKAFGAGFVDPVKYAHLVEYGRVAVTVKRAKVLAGQGRVWGRRVRAMAPRPFMRPAWEKYRAASPGIIAGFVHEAIRRYWSGSRRAA